MVVPGDGEWMGLRVRVFQGGEDVVVGGLFVLSVIPSQVSARFGHESDVGVKWAWSRGWFFRHCRTSSVVCGVLLSMVRCNSMSG